MQFTPFCLMLSACIRVSPDRSQFFRYDTITMSCEDVLNSTGWKVKRKTLEGGVRPCSLGWGSTSSGSTCIIGNIYPSDGGVYWCESVDGKQSNGVNITITDRTVILESPALPVSEGAAVTLYCKAETRSPDHVFNFYKDGRPIGSSSTGQMTIHSVSKSDEGLYMCSVSGGEESRASWLAVEASSSSRTASCSVSVLKIMFHLLVGTPYLLSTILLGLIYRDRRRAAQTVAKRRGSNDVIMDIVV
ncbi:Fc receptor-like protein 5 isoform X1 [Seriola aureovittata]|uniref:Fc receptor-like protein 5 isoform X1 n=2 Tax=Seriola TaxID=8160 RepID=UPI0024BD65E3|nr:Fc receptor-like protein 5 isoform X1 [Seriola aureovittata]